MFSRGRSPARRAPRMYERGILCIAIGAAVLVAPYFLTNPMWLNMIAGASVVGWFAVVLGVALTAVDLLNRAKSRKNPNS